MVHNGIEYGDMQLICEAYHLMSEGLDLTHDEIGDVFEFWNKGELDSFLIEITKDIMKFKDDDGTPLVVKIKDTAGQVCIYKYINMFFIYINNLSIKILLLFIERYWKMDCRIIT
jgi:6-phosphogluconate dehydrogenase